MKSIVIEAAGLSKAYQLGETGFSSLSGIFGSTNQFWALRDVSFQICEHEAVGIIGSNGAGKSTLLKILSRVTAPTSGRARVLGRMGAILEVGTGFHPELSGRENIYLSGTILGMSKTDIDRRFDEIVDFAGVEKFVDTPVKRYSSGMYVRLAFAVAAHLEPDILIVDEVLAVGDVAFQKKCLAKMDANIQKSGRTIIFVSHNMQAVRSLCTRALLLKDGQLIGDGAVSDILRQYASHQTNVIDLRSRSLGNRLNRARGNVRVSEFKIAYPDHDQTGRWSLRSGEDLSLHVSYQVHEPIETLGISLLFSSVATGELLVNVRRSVSCAAMMPGQSGRIEIKIPKLPLTPGEFAISAALGSGDFSVVDDLIDSNVHLPHLTVEPSIFDSVPAQGLFVLNCDIEHFSGGVG